MSAALPSIWAIVDDHSREGPIALPELTYSIEHNAIPSGSDAIALARAVLLEYFEAGRIDIHRGRALGDELLVVSEEDEARSLIEATGSYVYGDGGEVRNWFSIPRGSAAA